MGSCTSSHLDAPCDFRGKVYAMEAGKCISYGRDIGSGWNHICTVKRNDHLELFVNGKKESVSTTFNLSDFDLSNGQPLRIGYGETDYFSGKIREVQAYDRALNNEEIKSIFNKRKKDADTSIE